MQVTFSPDDIRPLVQTVAAEILEAIHADDGRLAYSEAEAAQMLGVKSHVLGDARRRGEIDASKVGGVVRYTKSDLLKFLASSRWNGRGA